MKNPENESSALSLLRYSEHLPREIDVETSQIESIETAKRGVKKFTEITDRVDDYLKTRDFQDSYVSLEFCIDIVPTWIRSPQTSKVFFDIETLSLMDDIEEPDTNPLHQVGFGIAVTIDDQGSVRAFDQHNLTEFCNYLLDHDEIISYNGLRFDNQVIRPFINGDQEIELHYKTFDFYKYMQWVSGSKRKLTYWSSKILNEVHPIKTSLNYSSSIPEDLNSGDPQRIKNVWDACFYDTQILYKLYNKLQPTITSKSAFYEHYLLELFQGYEDYLIEEDATEEVRGYIKETVDFVEVLELKNKLLPLQEIQNSRYYQVLNRDYLSKHIEFLLQEEKTRELDEGEESLLTELKRELENIDFGLINS